MFRLFRYYSVASAIAIVVVTVGLVTFYRQNAINQLTEAAESGNVALARAFANNLWPQFSSYITSVAERDGDVLRGRLETRRIHDLIPRPITREMPDVDSFRRERVCGDLGFRIGHAPYKTRFTDVWVARHHDGRNIGYVWQFPKLVSCIV